MIEAVPITSASTPSTGTLSDLLNGSNDFDFVDNSTLYLSPANEGDVTDIFAWLLLLLGLIAASILLYLIFEKVLFRNRRGSAYFKVEERRIRVRPPIVY